MHFDINRGSQSIGDRENEGKGSKERHDHGGKLVEQQRSASRGLKREANGPRRGFYISPHPTNHLKTGKTALMVVYASLLPMFVSERMVDMTGSKTKHPKIYRIN